MRLPTPQPWVQGQLDPRLEVKKKPQTNQCFSPTDQPILEQI